MPKAVNMVDRSHSEIKCAIDNLEKAMQMAEKNANKEIINQAIGALNSACSKLDSYND